MATALNLFPARVRFTNADGTLTPEAYRALQVLFERVGGSLGDSGVDVFAAFGGDMDATMRDVSARETLMQPASIDGCCQFPDLSQATGTEMLFPDVVQPAGGNSTDKVVVKAGTAALPSITTEGDENTGIYFPTADSVGVTAGGTERVRFGAGVSVPSGQRIYLDGLAGTGDTYLVESAPNTIQLVVGGVTALTLTSTGSTLITPNLGTPSALVGTNITGTAAGLTAGALVSGSGVTGTKTPPTSLTVTNGLVTAWT